VREKKLVDILRDRENLQAWIQEHGAEVWNLTETATNKQAYDMGRKAPFLLARTNTGQKYLLLSKPGYGHDKDGNHKQDILYVWLADNLPLFGGEDLPPREDVVTITVPREKIGRPRRVLTAEEKEKAITMLELHYPINRVAKEIKCSNLLIMDIKKGMNRDGQP
jgi:hypothetical protein